MSGPLGLAGFGLVMMVVMMMMMIICQSWVLTNDQRWDLVKALVGQLPLGSVRFGSGSEQVFLGFAFDNSLQHIGIVRKKLYRHEKL